MKIRKYELITIILSSLLLFLLIVIEERYLSGYVFTRFMLYRYIIISSLSLNIFFIFKKSPNVSILRKIYFSFVVFIINLTVMLVTIQNINHLGITNQHYKEGMTIENNHIPSKTF